MPESRILYTPRQPKRKQKKFSGEKLRVILAFAGFFALLALFGGAVHLPYFQIRDIEINEATTAAGAMITVERDERELRTVLDELLAGRKALVIPRRFIFAVGSRNLEERLLTALPRFESITVAKRFPHALSISYVKRIFFALLCSDRTKSEIRSCGYVDRTGFIYEDAPEASGSLIVKIQSDLPEVKIGMRAIDEATIRQMAIFGDGVRRISGLRLTAYELTRMAPDELRLRVAPSTGGEFTLIVKKNDDPESALQILQTVLVKEIKNRASRLDYVDLRLGSKVFYKYKGKKSVW